MENWINIKDRKPMFYFGAKIIARLSNEKYKILSYDENYGYWQGEDGIYYENIHFWMPIPEFIDPRTITNIGFLKRSIHHIDESFEEIKNGDFDKTTSENLEIIFECIGKDLSALKHLAESLKSAKAENL